MNKNEKKKKKRKKKGSLLSLPTYHVTPPSARYPTWIISYKAKLKCLLLLPMYASKVPWRIWQTARASLSPKPGSFEKDLLPNLGDNYTLFGHLPFYKWLA